MSEPEAQAARWRPTPGRWTAAVRAASLAVMAASLLLLARDLPLAEARAALEREVAALGPWAPLAFGLIYVLAALLFFPASMLTIAAGALFGLFLGTLVASAAATVTVALAFLIGRTLARSAVLRLARRHPRLAAIDRAVSADGWKVVALLRLTPAVSFALQNYLYGATGISLRTCVLTSAVAMLPGTLLYVSLGALGRRGLETAGGSPLEWALLGLGLLAIVALTVHITRLARRALREQAGTGSESGLEEVVMPASRAGPWVTPALVVVALVLAAAAGFVHFHPETIKHFLGAQGKDGRTGASLGRGPGRVIS